MNILKIFYNFFFANLAPVVNELALGNRPAIHNGPVDDLTSVVNEAGLGSHSGGEDAGLSRAGSGRGQPIQRDLRRGRHGRGGGVGSGVVIHVLERDLAPVAAAGLQLAGEVDGLGAPGGGRDAVDAVVGEETLLLVLLLLGGHHDGLLLADLDGLLGALLVLDALALGRGHGAAVGGVLDLAGHAGGHLGLLGLLAVGVGDLVGLLAVDLGHLEVNLSGDELALPPGHRLARLVSGPNLESYKEN